jgi:glutaredoxin
MIKIEYYFNKVCPYCPAAKNLIDQLVTKNADIELEDVDTWTEEGIKRGMALNIMAIPAVVINGKVKIVGWPFEASDLQKFIDEAAQQPLR